MGMMNFKPLKRLKRLDRHMQEVLRGASAAFAVKVVAALLSLALNVALARLLDPHGLGLYLLALTVMTVGATLGKIGLPNALMRHTASSAAVSDWGAVKGVYHQGMTLAAIFSTLVAVLICALAPFGAERLFSNPELTSPFRWMSLAVVPFAISFLFAQLLKGRKHTAEGLLVESVLIPGFCILGVMLLAPRWGVAGAAWAYAGACALAASIGFILWRRANPDMGTVKAAFDRRDLLKSSIPLFWMNCLQLVTQCASTLMLGAWRSSSEVGIFGVANRTAVLTSFVLIAVNSIAAPKFAALYREGNLGGLERTARHSATLMALFAGPLLLVMLIAPTWILSFFGPAFREGATVLRILALGQFVNVITGSVGYVLMMSGHETTMRNVVGVCAVVNLALNILLIPTWGILGAAVATSAGISIQNLIGAVLVRRKLGIMTLPMFGLGVSRGTGVSSGALK